ncbi:MAG: hypothetical protein K6G16_05695, partial [Lachnospiraceae bacterium]|nr:hypothetical protein [Lachnospiraceae bacterium]
SIRYGFDAYPRMIAGLFSMTEGASDYTLSGMLFDTLRAYTASAVEMLPLLFVLAFGTLIFALTRGRRVLRTAGILVFAFLLAFLFRIYYSAGVFTRSYYYYDCMFEPAMMVIIFGLILCVLAVFGVFRTDPLLRSASFLTILVILILPIGSNNYTFPIVNDLFLILPVTGLLFFRAVQSLAKTAASETARHTALAEGARLPVIAAGALLFLLLAVQATLFHCFYTFGDGMDGSRRDATVSIPRAAGMITTSTGKRALEELYLRCSELSAEEAVIFGNAPGLHYLLELQPALFTAWPDLDSNETKRIEEALTALAASDDRPLVILRGNGTRNGSPWDFGAPEKADLILDYLSETGYNKLFRVEAERGTFYEVYGCE